MEFIKGLPSLIVLVLVIRWILKSIKASKERKAMDALIKENPCDEIVDKYMDFYNKKNYYNTPQDWNIVRGIWFIVNESPNVTTAKKKELRDMMMTKGLRIVGGDKNVIDNYKAK